MTKANIVLNPLVLFNMESSDSDTNTALYNSDSLLHDLCWDPNSRKLKDLKERYKKLRTVSHSMYSAPAEKRILEKVIAPLRQAMANYVLSNYLSTIALCGMVAEMLAMLLYDIILENSELFGIKEPDQLISFKYFQKKGQQKRVEYLLSLGIVDPDIAKPFTTIMKIRRNYLHFYLATISRLEEDSFEVFKCAVSLANKFLLQRFDNNHIAYHPLLLKYLKSKGVIRDV